MLIIGRNPIIEALKSNFKITHIWLQQEARQDSKLNELVELAKINNIQIDYVPLKTLTQKAKDDQHQGVVADLQFETQDLNKDYLKQNHGLYVYIREAQYEHNLGAIVRTAEAAGAKGVIIQPKQDITATVARISMGAIFHIPVFSYSLFPAIKLFHDNQYFVGGMEIIGSTPLYETSFPENLMLIVGGEDHGLGEEMISKCDFVVRIPQFGKVNSLNMSVAAAVVIYEYVRQTSNN